MFQVLMAQLLTKQTRPPPSRTLCSGGLSSFTISHPAHLIKIQCCFRFQKEKVEARTETEFITCPVVWFPNRPNATQTEVLLTLPSCFCHSELTAAFQELDISFPTNLRLVLCFLLFSSNERAILLPNNIFALHPDNPE